MTQSLAKGKQALSIEQALIVGDLSGLSTEQRINYYNNVCSSLGLNRLTKPFDYLNLNGRLVLYARKDCTDQLRTLHKVSISKLEREQIGDLYVVTAYGVTKDGRTDSDVGAVNIKGLSGENLANAMLKAVTKAKRRLTLALCGLGMLDESEVDSIPGAYPELTGEPYTPAREQEVDDRDLVRAADDRMWKRYMQLVDQAHALGLNPVILRLPVERDELKVRGSELVDSITQRQEQLDKEEAARIVARANDAAQNLDEMERTRQQAKEGLL